MSVAAATVERYYALPNYGGGFGDLRNFDGASGIGGANAIAFGTAESAGVRFENNLAAGPGYGFNVDTAPVTYAQLEGNCFLDVWGLIMGSTGAQRDTSHFLQNVIRRNAIRLRGRYEAVDYADYCLQTSAKAALAPPNVGVEEVYSSAHPPGRRAYIGSVGIALDGGHGPVDVSENRFTTWPSGKFVLSPRLASTTVPSSEFHAVDAGHLVVFPDPANPAQTISDARRTFVVDFRRCASEAPVHVVNRPSPTSDYTFPNNRVSKIAFDFGKVSVEAEDQLLPSARTRTAIDNAPEMGDPRPAPSLEPSGFSPHPSLRIGRAQMDIDASGRLWVTEISLQATVLNANGQIQLVARTMRHPTGPLTSGVGTEPVLEAGSLKLRVETPQPNPYVESVPTLSDGNSRSTWTLTPNPVRNHDRVRLTVWKDLSPADGTAFQPDNDLWSTVDLAYGDVLAAEAYNDLADDKASGSAGYGRFLIRRVSSVGSVAAGQANVLYPKFRILKLDTTAVPAPGSGLAVPRPATPTTDYKLWCAGCGTGGATVQLTPNPGLSTTEYDLYDDSTTLKLAADREAVVIEVRPVADNVTEVQGVYLQFAEANAGAPFVSVQDRKYGRK